ncbi:hypothetical protein IQ241_09395 [Romeria aff. gracilis LEGE 07310]|uniref:Uncharacterized protein n=1 Tax=Vasconcelosia minhoensis LEGE 07310 TaxID=915328 RepID=A0A8J7DN03_9CYAN|nr:hypothetical protein [Romeria gracilis]MBE9077510.1 hypothetical protein [Romeria aff. gracilis LEGE 07310]
MNAHKVAATLTEDGKLLLTGLPFQAGDTIEIILLEQPKERNSSQANLAQLEHPLQGTVLRYEDPFEPAMPVEEWEI